MIARIVEVETILVEYLSADGQTYEITVTIPEEANIPRGSELHVSEISEQAVNENGEKYVDTAASVLKLSEEEIKYVNY